MGLDGMPAARGDAYGLALPLSSIPVTETAGLLTAEPETFSNFPTILIVAGSVPIGGAAPESISAFLLGEELPAVPVTIAGNPLAGGLTGELPLLCSEPAAHARGRWIHPQAPSSGSFFHSSRGIEHDHRNT